MTSPARQSFERKAAAARGTPAAAAAGRAGPSLTAYELQRAGLGEDLRALKDIQSIESKIDRKRILLPKYDAWTQGATAAAADLGPGQADQDDIMVQTMIWAIDTGDAARALPLARQVIRHRMELPSRFERTTGCLIAEEFAEGALKSLHADDAALPDLDVLLEVEEMTAEEDMPDQVRAKLNKAIGLIIARQAEQAGKGDAANDGPAGGVRASLLAAGDRYRRALELDSKSGVKKLIERNTTAIAKLETSDPQ